jgi:hypothetical protein
VIYVVDACAIIAYLRGEPGADGVSAVLIDPTHVCVAHALNLCEVCYDFSRASGETAVGVQPRSDLSIDFWQKAGHSRLRYAGSRWRTVSPSLWPRRSVERCSLPITTSLIRSPHRAFSPLHSSGEIPAPASPRTGRTTLLARPILPGADLPGFCYNRISESRSNAGSVQS